MNQAALLRAQNTRLHVEATGRSTSIPNDNIARLMYYLNCISCILDDCVPSNLRNYSQYYSLSSQERMLVIGLAVELTPDKIPVFIQVPSLPDGSGNEFFTFSSLEETLTALGIQSGGAAMMALSRQVGNKKQLIKVMAYTPSWIRNNYLNPLMAIKSEMERQQRAERQKKQCAVL